MKVQFCPEIAKKLSQQYQLKANPFLPRESDTLESNKNRRLRIDKEYIVYAITLYEEILWYCLCDENYTYYPMWKPSLLFEVVDPRLSRYWIYNFDVKEISNYALQPIWSYPEWARDLGYYDKLTDGEPVERELFEKYKELMDLEFPDPAITEYAQIGDDEWLTCPDCIDAWKHPGKEDALVKCPKCNVVMNNPRYQNKPTY